MEQAFSACLGMLLLNIKRFGYTDQELKEYRSSIEAFIKDNKVAEELLNAVREPGRDDLPSPEVLGERWKALDGQELPSETLWNDVAIAFRRQARKRIILSDELRALLNAQNLDQLKKLIERQGGVKVQVRRDRYSQRMRTKFSPVDQANLMPAYADDPGRMVIREVFVAQNVRENPPPIEIPKDLAERLKKGGGHEAGDDTDEALDEQQLRKLRTTYVSQSPQPVLDVIATASNRLLVLTGDPGSGKSTLMRYLLTGIIEPPVDGQSGEPLPWTLAFKDAFPLLIELRDFYALRRRDECDSFLEYVAYMGKTDQWFLDDHGVHDYLENGPSLVMFDGLDEIFNTADRQRVMLEIAGFAQRYRRARIIVTARPVGYKEQILRDTGFAHFSIQDLNEEQIETFIRGWFALTFPQQPQQATQRIERVLGSVRQLKPIRLLAGNPMLLTIIALLAREQELPRERAKFFEKAVEVLCHYWDTNRNLELPEDRYMNADDKKALLRRIAMRIKAGVGGLKGNIIQEEDLEQEVLNYLLDEQWQPNAAEARNAARRMIRQLRERNYILCLRGPHLYGFVHRTFLEYMTAAEYVRRFDRQPQQMTIDELVELFDQHCRDDDWHEVLRLICGQIDEQFVGRIVEHLATRVDSKLWDGETALLELPLAIWCLTEVTNTLRLDHSGRILMDRVVALTSVASAKIDVSSFLFERLANASTELGERWPSGELLVDLALPQCQKIKNVWAQWFWPRFVAAVTGARQIVTELANDSRDMIRASSLTVLAENWPDDITRQLLTSRVTSDEIDAVRLAAFEALVRKWPDETTRKLLSESAVVDKNHEVRCAAFRSLAEKWPDATTRTLLSGRAIQDENSDVRRTAFRELSEKWPDKSTLQLLTSRAIHDLRTDVRSDAFRALADKWPTTTTRKLLTVAAKDESSVIRSVALQLLVSGWPTRATKDLLQSCATTDTDYSARATALQLLADNWPDSETAEICRELAITHGSPEIRFLAAKILALIWWEQLEIRQFVRGVASSDESQTVRSSLRDYIGGLRYRLAGVWENYLYELLPREDLPHRPNGFPALRISEFRVRNISVFKDTDIVTTSDKLTLFLGDNATGKTTVLKCLALATVGIDAANEVEQAAVTYLRKHTDSGAIEVLFDLVPEPGCYPNEYGRVAVGLQILENSDRFMPLPEAEMTLRGNRSGNCIGRLSDLRNRSDFTFGLTCAYGARRTFTSSRFTIEQELKKDENEWVLPLFDPDAPLMNPQVLSRLVHGDTRNFKDAPDSLRDEIRAALQQHLRHLLPQVEEVYSTGSNDIRLSEIDLTFAELSDGYRSLLAAVGHLIRSSLTLNRWEADPTQVHGIVLIDEVDLHLHPSWQKQVLTDLQTAFPNIQFIVSSHSPLIAGALSSESILKMVSDGSTSNVIPLQSRMSETPSMKAWRADQILTGPGFELDSSVSDEAVEWQNEFDSLSDLSESERTAEQQARLEELARLLDREVPRWQETPDERKAAELFERWALEKVFPDSADIVEETKWMLRKLRDGEES